MGLILKLLGNLGTLSSILADLEQDLKDLFAGKLSAADATQLMSDVMKVLSSGLIQLPAGVTLAQIQDAVSASKNIGGDLIQAVKDISSGGVAAVVPDLSKACDDIAAAISGNAVTLTNATKEQVLQIIAEVKAGL